MLILRWSELFQFCWSKKSERGRCTDDRTSCPMKFSHGFVGPDRNWKKEKPRQPGPVELRPKKFWRTSDLDFVRVTHRVSFFDLGIVLLQNHDKRSSLFAIE